MFEERDVITTIDACIDRWHILIAEVSTDILNKAERERESTYQGSYEDGLHDGK